MECNVIGQIFFTPDGEGVRRYWTPIHVHELYIYCSSWL